MLGRILTITTLLAAIILGIIIQSTSPASSGPSGILAVFFCIYVIAVGLITWLVQGLSWAYMYTIGSRLRKKSFRPLEMRESYYYASVTALAPVILIGMSSVGRLTFYETALILLFVVIGVFYIKKRS